MRKPTIALLTDFGQSDPFVGVMKGVILSRCPDAKMVDLTHDVHPQDIRQGAFYLMVSTPYFPKDTLFVCVVDPGVGSDRRILWARTKTHQFLAPDNGLLSWVAGKEPFQEIREVTNRKLFASHVSRTFHGRDIFAPVAAEIARGKAPSMLGKEVSQVRMLPFPKPQADDGLLRGCVLAIDRFGNAITNITQEDIKPDAKIWFKDKQLGQLKSHYVEVEQASALALVGSCGYVELAVRDGNFASRFNAQAGDSVDVGF